MPRRSPSPMMASLATTLMQQRRSPGRMHVTAAPAVAAPRGRRRPSPDAPAAAPIRRGPPRAARLPAEAARQRNAAARARLLHTINQAIIFANLAGYSNYRPTLNAFRNFAAENKNSRRLVAKAKAIITAFSRLPAGDPQAPGLSMARKVEIGRRARALLRNYSNSHANALEAAVLMGVRLPRVIRNAILEGVARYVGAPSPERPTEQRPASVAGPANARAAARQAARTLLAAAPAAALQTGRAAAQRGRRAATATASTVRASARRGRSVGRRAATATASTIRAVASLTAALARRMARFGGPLFGSARQRANF